MATIALGGLAAKTIRLLIDNMVDPDRLAAAKIFDGEGCVSVVTNKWGNVAVKLVVGTCDTGAEEWADIVGCKQRRVSTVTTGNVTKCKRIMRCQVTSQPNVVRVLKYMLPYLTQKRRVAKVALAMLSTPSKPGAHIDFSVRSMRQRGERRIKKIMNTAEYGWSIERRDDYVACVRKAVPKQRMLWNGTV